jgi:hypothetical protein
MPGCFTETLPHISGDNGKFPHVLPASYPKG